MSKKEIIEGNKLIAEFMGYEYIPSSIPVDLNKKHGWNRKLKWHPFFTKTMSCEFYPPQRYYLGRSHYVLLFHDKWGWLMPVVEKISSVGAVIPNERIGIVDILAWVNGCRVQYNFRTKEEDPDSACDVIFVKGKPKLIDSVFEAVVEFVKWYNKQK